MLIRRLALIASLVVLSVAVAPTSRAQSAQRCFRDVPGITNCIEGRFLQYWEQNGGLAVFGYPISAAAEELNRDTNQTFLTQWFERNRFELHPENARPYDVLLGRLGDDALRKQGRDWQTFPKANPSAAHFFPPSGHAIAHGPFWGYWSTNGLEFDGQRGKTQAESLALFGLPISEPAMETNSSGDTVLTQWFERARFEDHGASGVLLGLLGNEVVRGVAPPPPVAKRPNNIQELVAMTDDSVREIVVRDYNGQQYRVEARATPGRYKVDIDESAEPFFNLLLSDAEKHGTKKVEIIVASNKDQIPPTLPTKWSDGNIGLYDGSNEFKPYRVGDFAVTKEGDTMYILYAPRQDMDLINPIISKVVNTIFTLKVLQATGNDNDSGRIPDASKGYVRTAETEAVKLKLR